MAKVSAETKSKAAALLQSGKSRKEVAEELGVSLSFVGNVAKSNKAVPAPAAAESPAIESDDHIDIETSEMISEEDATAFLDGLEEPAPKPTQEEIKETKSDIKALKALERVMSRPSPQASPKAPRRKRGIRNKPEDDGEDAEEKGLLVAAIIDEVELYAPLLKSFLTPTPQAFIQSLPKRRLPELQALHASVKRTRMMGNLTNSLKHGLFIGAGLIEVGGRFAGLHTQGYRDAIVNQQQELTMILREIANNNPAWGTAQKPEYRLAMVMAGTLLAIDGKNRLAAAAPRAVAPDVANKYDDLDSAPVPVAPATMGASAPPPKVETSALPTCPVKFTSLTAASLKPNEILSA
jgi:hypothetical protein